MIKKILNIRSKCIKFHFPKIARLVGFKKIVVRKPILHFTFLLILNVLGQFPFFSMEFQGLMFEELTSSFHNLVPQSAFISKMCAHFDFPRM